MYSGESTRLDVCGRRYQQLRASGKAGWADEASYAMFHRRLEAILTSCRMATSIRFLELGCGNGNVAIGMGKKGHEAYGIDVVPQAIEWAKQQAKTQQVNARFEVGSAVTLTPYADESFDLVFDANCLFMIIEKKDRKKCVANAFRVLKRGGLFYAEAHLVNEAVKERMQTDDPQVWFDPDGQYSTVQGHPMYYHSREREFLDLISGNGFEILQQVKEPRPSDYPPYCAGDMWVLATKPQQHQPAPGVSRRGDPRA
ncbi:MAG: class I SAM-dependent methyltransferase [Kiritimatiellae bacterium]|nr:class I SAM-dependent methyltransferase [Kiritimatiellia bacterium]